MKAYYWKSKLPNFGDDLNEWLWDALDPAFPLVANDVVFLGVGTILRAGLPQGRTRIVFSSGAGYDTLPEDVRSPAWHIHALRGPLTVRALGLDGDAAGAVRGGGAIITGDGALLLQTLPEFRLPRGDRTIFVPHWASSSTLYERACAQAGIDYVSPTGACKSVIRRIVTARLVLAESMHAAIIADAFRVPWVPVFTSGEINSFKWLDWALSVDAPFQPLTIVNPSLDSRVREILLGLQGKRYATVGGRDVAAADAEMVLRRTMDRYARPPSRLHGRLRHLARRIGDDVVMPRLQALADSPAMAEARRRATDQVAAALAQAARMPGYLSPDTSLRRTTERLQQGFAEMMCQMKAQAA